MTEDAEDEIKGLTWQELRWKEIRAWLVNQRTWSQRSTRHPNCQYQARYGHVGYDFPLEDE
jgi:hypothetical protein